MARDADDLTRHEKLLFDYLQNAPEKTATVDQLGQSLSVELKMPIRRQLIIQIIRYLRAKLNGTGWNIVKLTKVGRGIKATYRLIEVPLIDQIETPRLGHIETKEHQE